MLDRNKARFSGEEYRQIVKKYPAAVAVLDTIKKECGNDIVIIAMNDLSNEVKNRLPLELIDDLYHKAYQLKEKKFMSYYYQLREILMLPKSKVNDVLEIGIGCGLFKAMIENYGYRYKSLDLKADTFPDYVGNVLKMPFGDSEFDIICAFEVLEHLPYGEFVGALKEMIRCSNRYIYLSLPAQINYISADLEMNFVQRILRRLSFKWSIFKTFKGKAKDTPSEHLLERSDVHNPHYWEVGRSSTTKDVVLNDILSLPVKILRTFHNPTNPYHYFILCEKKR